jgi:hypothetical protein
MSMRANYVPEELRATIINIFRIPLNAFVCVVLGNVSDGWPRELPLQRGCHCMLVIPLQWSAQHAPQWTACDCARRALLNPAETRVCFYTTYSLTCLLACLRACLLSCLLTYMALIQPKHPADKWSEANTAHGGTTLQGVRSCIESPHLSLTMLTCSTLL